MEVFAACTDLPCHSERSIEDAESKNPFLFGDTVMESVRHGGSKTPALHCGMGCGEEIGRWAEVVTGPYDEGRNTQ